MTMAMTARAPMLALALSGVELYGQLFVGGGEGGSGGGDGRGA